MNPPNFIVYANEPPYSVILSACGQRQGKRSLQEDCTASFNDECFVITDGVGGMPHGDVAAKLAAETAIWGYKHIRLRPYYWADKKLFLRRIFRSSNIAVWQKRRETGFTDGLATTLVVCIVGARNYWIGSVGDSSAFLCREGLIEKLTTNDTDAMGYLTKAIGTARFGLTPQYTSGQFLHDDILVLATDGATNFVSEDELRTILDQTGDTAVGLQNAVSSILTTAETNGGVDNMSACLIKRITRSP